MVGRKFKLEQVLGYRCEMERLRKQEFASARMAHEEAAELLQREKDYVVGLTEEFRQRQHELSSIDELRMYADYFIRKRDDIKNQEERVEELDQVVSDRRNDLLDAAKDKKVLEALKEKKLQEFKQKQLQKEREFMDEISVQKKVNPE